LFDREDEVANHFSFNWLDGFSEERTVKLRSGKDAHFVVRTLADHQQKSTLTFYFKVFKEVVPAYSENTEELNRLTFNLYVYPALHLTNLLPVDIQCSIDVSLTFISFLSPTVINGYSQRLILYLPLESRTD
jgi:hypothetical protein